MVIFYNVRSTYKVQANNRNIALSISIVKIASIKQFPISANIYIVNSTCIKLASSKNMVINISIIDIASMK